MMFAARKSRVLGVVAAVLGLVLVAAGCSSRGGAQSSQGGPTANGRKLVIAMVTHEAPGQTFWDIVRAGAQAAAKELPVELKYSGDVDANQQATLVQNAIDSKVDALAVTLAFPDQVGTVVQKAERAGVATVAFNSGLTTYQKYGVRMYFGSDEDLAGQAAGRKIAESGAKHALCVLHEQGNSSLETRCAGVKKTFPSTDIIYVNGSDLPSVTQTITAKLSQDRSIDYVMSLAANMAMTMLPAINEAGSSAKLATFDLNRDVAQAIQSKQIQFSVDQQPYVQGYLAVQALYLALTNGNDIGGGKPVLTGPSLVDNSNIDTIARYAANNTR